MAKEEQEINTGTSLEEKLYVKYHQSRLSILCVDGRPRRGRIVDMGPGWIELDNYQIINTSTIVSIMPAGDRR